MEATRTIRAIPSSLKLTMIGVFVALTVVLALMPLPSIGVINIVAVMETIGGVVASTLLIGAIGVALGAIIHNLYKPSFFFLQLGFLPMAIGALSIGLIMLRKHIYLAIAAVILLILFIVAPGTQLVPLWTIWDCILAIVLIFPAATLVKKTFKAQLDKKWLFPTILLVSFVGLELDSLMGNVLFGWYGYQMLGMSLEDMSISYLAVAFTSVIERLGVAIISALITVPLVIAIDSMPNIRWLIHRE
jgi:hypothetical protein